MAERTSNGTVDKVPGDDQMIRELKDLQRIPDTQGHQETEQINDSSKLTKTAAKDISSCSCLQKAKTGISSIIPRHYQNNHLLTSLPLFFFFNYTSKYVLDDLRWLYVKYQLFHWSASKYSAMEMYKYLLQGLACPFLVKLFKTLKCDDKTTFLIGSALETTGTITFAFTQFEWMIWTSVTIKCLGIFSTSSARTLIAGIVDNTEYGKTFALIGSIEMLGGVLAPLLLNNIYSLTVTSWPGLTFLVEGVIGILLFIYVYFANNCDQQ